MLKNVQKLIDFAICPDSISRALEKMEQWEKEKILAAHELQLVRDFREKQKQPRRFMPLHHS